MTDITEIVDHEIRFKRPVDFDDVYEYTTAIIIERWPKTEDLLEILSDMDYDNICIDLRQYFIELAKEQGMYIETEE